MKSDKAYIVYHTFANKPGILYVIGMGPRSLTRDVSAARRFNLTDAQAMVKYAEENENKLGDKFWSYGLAPEFRIE